MTPGQSYRQFLSLCARFGAVLVGCVGVAVMTGWLLDIAPAKSVLPGLATMKFNTACAFLAAGVALWLLQSSTPGSQAARVSRILAASIVAIAALTLFEIMTGIDLGIDQLIVADISNIAHPGQMAPATTLGLLAIGLALLALKSPRKELAARAHWFALAALFVASLAVLGYAYGASALYAITPYATIAAHTALSLLAISLAVLAADTDYGLTRIAVSDTAGGVICRRLLPTLPIALFALGWLRLLGQKAGLYGTEFGLALMVLLGSLVMMLAVGNTAVQLHRLDITRKRAQSELAELNAELEARVAERTQQLARVADELKTVNLSLEKLSQHDGLTGVANRRLFDSHLSMQAGLAQRSGEALALILVDVDSFKAFNDHYGHLAGDECLKRIAGALQSCCRRPADLVARYGGEEFAILLPGTDLAGAVKIAEAARHAVARLRIPHARSHAGAVVSISGGVAVFDHARVTTSQQLIDAADQNLYRAKELGRNRTISPRAEAA
jgi:diguanylate cyclase (GGDEF)-like protein